MQLDADRFVVVPIREDGLRRTQELYERYAVSSAHKRLLRQRKISRRKDQKNLL